MENQQPSLLLAHLSEPEAPKDLFDRVMLAIQHARIRQWRHRFTLLLSGLIISLGYAVINWSLLWEEIHASSFFEFIRLAVSDPDIIFSNSKDFVFGLLEALPSGTILAFALALFFLIGVTVFTNALRHLRKTSSSLHHLLPLH